MKNIPEFKTFRFDFKSSKGLFKTKQLKHKQQMCYVIVIGSRSQLWAIYYKFLLGVEL